METKIDIREKQFHERREREFRESIERSLEGREPIGALCIDDPKVKIPEDSITVTENRDGSFFTRVSFPDIRVLDPGAISLYNLISRLRENPEKPLNLGKATRNKEKLIFQEGIELPCFTVQGNFRADRGISNVEIIKSRVTPSMFTYNDREELEQDERYQSARNFAYSFAKYQSRAGSRSRFVTERKKYMNVHPGSVVEQAMIFANTSFGIFASKGGYSSIYRVLDRSKNTGAGVGVSNKPGWHEGVRTETYVEVSNSLRRLSSWICSLTVLYAMDNGKLPLNHEDTRLIAEVLSA